MNGVLTYLTALALAVVLAVLLLGLWNMMRGRNPKVSQKLMRWRVGLQLLAILLIIATVYLVR